MCSRKTRASRRTTKRSLRTQKSIGARSTTKTSKVETKTTRSRGGAQPTPRSPSPSPSPRATGGDYPKEQETTITWNETGERAQDRATPHTEAKSRTRAGDYPWQRRRDGGHPGREGDKMRTNRKPGGKGAPLDQSATSKWSQRSILWALPGKPD